MTARSFRHLWWVALFGVITASIALWQSWAPAADHRDGPIFINTSANGQLDINDVYIFQSPSNVNNTVMILTVSPFAGVLTPTTFDQNVTFNLYVDNNQDAIPDLTFEMTFGAPNSSGVQQVTVRGLPSTKFPPTGIVAKGMTGQNIAVPGGGMFRAAVQDDPFFFDSGGFSTFIENGTATFPRAVGTAHNFFGPSSNLLAMTFELPTKSLLSSPSNPNVGVFATTSMNGVQQDRMGRPAINTALIPPIPRSNTSRGDRRNAFNAGLPRNDVRDFQADMLSTLTSFYGRPRNTSANPPLTSADGIANFLLPDILTFNTTTAFTTNELDSNGFPNGRRLRDAVIHFELNLLTNGAITTDNVNDDNGDLITDGTMRANGTFRPIAFPYIGAPNANPTGPNP
jgi:hypothetical protein